MEVETPDAEEQALRELGQQQDQLEGRPSSEGTPTPEQPVPPAEVSGQPQPRPEITPPSDSEPESEPPPAQQPAARERDERGRFKGAQEDGQQAEVSQEPPKSRYAQAREREAKDAERYDRSWQRLQQEKEAFNAQRAQFQDAYRMAQLQQQARPPKLEKDGIDLAGYHKAYLDFRQRGDFENAMRSLETVLELQGQGQNYVAQNQEAAYELAWRNDMESAIQQIPMLQDPNSPLTQETDRIINEHPYLFYIPQGFHKAIEIATLLLASGSDSELREELERKNAYIEQLERRSQPARGGPGQPPRGPARQEDMSLDEEEAYLRDLTKREDSIMSR